MLGFSCQYPCVSLQCRGLSATLCACGDDPATRCPQKTQSSLLSLTSYCSLYDIISYTILCFLFRLACRAARGARGDPLRCSCREPSACAALLAAWPGGPSACSCASPGGASPARSASSLTRSLAHSANR